MGLGYDIVNNSFITEVTRFLTGTFRFLCYCFTVVSKDRIKQNN